MRIYICNIYKHMIYIYMYMVYTYIYIYTYVYIIYKKCVYVYYIYIYILYVNMIQGSGFAAPPPMGRVPPAGVHEHFALKKTIENYM